MPSTIQLRRATTGRALFAAVAVAAASLVAPSPAANAAEPLTVQRFSGPDRYATAAALAKAAYPSGADVVLIASGESFPDALAATSLAGTSKAPVLLTGASDAPEATLEALRTLRPSRLVAVGGPARISEAALAQLQAGAGTASVERIAGLDRYSTASQVAQSLPPAGIGRIDGKPTAILATGERFPDALSAGSVAAAKGLPLLLTPPGALPPLVGETLTKLGITQVVLLGGPSSVSSSVEAALTAKGLSTVRLGGADRQATAATVADWAVDKAGMSSSRVALARGDDAGGGADALALGPLAGQRRAPVLLAQSPQQVGAATRAWAGRRGATLTNLDVAGGPNAVSDAVVEDVRRGAAGLPEVPTPPSIPPAGGVCTGVASCQKVASIDVDGDGIADDVALVDRRSDENKVDVRVLTASGLLEQTVETYNGFVAESAWKGATDVDGIPGAELIILETSGAHTLFEKVLTVRNKKLMELPWPDPDDGSTISGETPTSWVVDGSATSGVGITCSPDRTVTISRHSGGAGNMFDARQRTFRWNGTGWDVLSDSGPMDVPQDANLDAYYGWNCGDLKSF